MSLNVADADLIHAAAKALGTCTASDQYTDAGETRHSHPVDRLAFAAPQLGYGKTGIMDWGRVCPSASGDCTCKHRLDSGIIFRGRLFPPRAKLHPPKFPCRAVPRWQPRGGNATSHTATFRRTGLPNIAGIDSAVDPMPFSARVDAKGQERTIINRKVVNAPYPEPPEKSVEYQSLQSSLKSTNISIVPGSSMANSQDRHTTRAIDLENPIVQRRPTHDCIPNECPWM